MSKLPRRLLIGLHHETPKGTVYNGESFEVEELGCVPVVGDVLTEPAVGVNVDRLDPDNRVFYEVIRRYIHQDDGRSGPRIILVVRERPAMTEEQDIIGAIG